MNYSRLRKLVLKCDWSVYNEIAKNLFAMRYPVYRNDSNFVNVACEWPPEAVLLLLVHFQ